MPLLFSYGSNTPEQLARRIGRRYIEGEPAYLPKHGRVFRGWSRNWQGGPASVIKDNSRTVYGWATNVTPAELDKLDRYEGVHSGNYVRKRKNVMVWNGRDFSSKRAVLYVSTSDEYNKPAKEYVKAIVSMINYYWPKERGSWKPRDIPLRNNRKAIKMDYGVPDGGMTRRQLKAMEADLRDLHDMLDDDDHLPPWLPPKVIRAQNDLSDARRIVRGELESRGIRTNPRHYRRNKKPKLIFLVGLTCVGKSYKVKELINQYGTSAQTVPVVLSTDNIVEDLARAEGITYDQFFATMGARQPNRFVAQVLPALNDMIDHATMNGLDVIVDMQNINQKSRSLTYDNPKFEGYELHAIVFDDDRLSAQDPAYLEAVKKACFVRSQSEPKTVPEHVIERSFAGYEAPTKAEGFKTIKKVKGSNPILRKNSRHYRRNSNSVYQIIREIERETDIGALAAQYSSAENILDVADPFSDQFHQWQDIMRAIEDRVEELGLEDEFEDMGY